MWLSCQVYQKTLVYTLLAVIHGHTVGAVEHMLLLQDQLSSVIETALLNALVWNSCLPESEKDVLASGGLIACHPTQPALIALAYQDGPKAYIKRFTIGQDGNLTPNCAVSTDNVKQITALLWDPKDDSVSLYLEPIESSHVAPAMKSLFQKYYQVYDPDFKGDVEELFKNFFAQSAELTSDQKLIGTWIQNLQQQQSSQQRIIFKKDVMHEDNVEHQPFADIDSTDFKEADRQALKLVKRSLTAKELDYKDIKLFVPQLAVAYVTQVKHFFYYTSSRTSLKYFFILGELFEYIDNQDKIAFFAADNLIIWKHTARKLVCLNYKGPYSWFPPVGYNEFWNLQDWRAELLHDSLYVYNCVALATAGTTSYCLMLLEEWQVGNKDNASFVLIEINFMSRGCEIIPLPDIKLKKELLAFNADGTMIFVVTEAGELLCKRTRD